MGRKKKRAFMYGFNKKNLEETGYLKVLDEGGYAVVKDRLSATSFEIRNSSRRLGWGSPAQWCDFFNGEDELSAWKFKPVNFLEARKK